MVGEYDERFEKLESLLQRAMGGVDEMRLEMRDLRTELRGHSSRFDQIDAGLGRQNDVIPKVIGIQKTVNRISEIQSEQTFKVIEMLNRLDVVEIHLRSLKDEANTVKSEIKEIREAIHSLIDPIRIGFDLQENLAEIERRVTGIEQKIAN